MSKVSVIIPSRNEQFMPQTVEDLFAKAGGEIEVIVVLDGYWPAKVPADRPGLIWIHRGEPRGMRDAINSGAAIAKGEFLMKVDAHCMFDEGWDVKLKADCDADWLVVPRRRSLDAENWSIIEKAAVDYEYLCNPYAQEVPGIHGRVWRERRYGREEILIDEDMSFQGSCWFMPSEFFRRRIGKMQEEGYGTFIGEPQEIGLKVWLGGGKQVRNKKTWYAHLHKGKQYGRGYFMGKSELERGNAYSVDYWMNNRWEGRVHDLEWLVERFWPVPSWPEERSEWVLNR